MPVTTTTHSYCDVLNHLLLPLHLLREVSGAQVELVAEQGLQVSHYSHLLRVVQVVIGLCEQRLIELESLRKEGVLCEKLLCCRWVQGLQEVMVVWLLRRQEAWVQVHCTPKVKEVMD